MLIFFRTDSGEVSTMDTRGLESKFDVLHKEGSPYSHQQREKGAKLAKTGAVMTIAINGVWGTKNGLSSYEKLGYHACTRDLVEGFVEAGGTLICYGFRGIEGTSYKVRITT